MLNKMLSVQELYNYIFKVNSFYTDKNERLLILRSWYTQTVFFLISRLKIKLYIIDNMAYLQNTQIVSNFSSTCN